VVANFSEDPDVFAELPFGEECTTGPCASNRGVGRAGRGSSRGRKGRRDRVRLLRGQILRIQIGRFTTVDPYVDQQAALVDPQPWIRSAYGANNPLKFVDPAARNPVIVIAIALAAAFVLNNHTNANVTQDPTHDGHRQSDRRSADQSKQSLR